MVKDLFGKLFADKGYISQKLFDLLLVAGAGNQGKAEHEKLADAIVK